MQGNIHLHISCEGVSSLLYQVPDDTLMLVFTGPDQWGPSSIILDIDVVPGQLVVPQDDMTALKVAILCCQVQGCHAIITL